MDNQESIHEPAPNQVTTAQEVADEVTDVTINDFYIGLKEKVSMSNARLLLNSAVVKTGLSEGEYVRLKKDDVKVICMELIRSGGPAFKVGTDIYSRLQ